MITVQATLEDIRPYFDPQHPSDRVRVQAIVDYMTDREWDLAPVVVLEDEGNGHTVLDGHHRLSAARKLELQTIPAWVVSIADYARLIDANFDGQSPNRLADLREYIICGDVDANSVCSHGDNAVSL